MDKMLEKFLDILTIISDGGPKAVVAIMCVGMALVITANYFLVKFMVKFFEKMNENRDRLVAEKDLIIKERVEKLEQLIQQYNKSQSETTDAIRKIETAVHDLSMIFQAYLTGVGGRNNDNRNNRRN